MRRNDRKQQARVQIYLDNLKYFKKLKNDQTVVNGIQETTFYSNTNDLNIDVAESKEVPTKVALVEFPKVEIWNMDTFDAAREMIHKGAKPLVLNMASDFHPGGGYKKGSMAQEEELFRRSSLSLSLEDPYCLQPDRTWSYPLQPYQMIYSPSVYVFRDKEYTIYNSSNCCYLDIISAAAIRNPKISKESYHKSSDQKLMLEKIRGIFKIAIDKKHKELVLGAFGCGAFNNPPKEVAKLFKQVIEEYGSYFTWIVFAILDNSRSNNYQIFMEHIKITNKII